LKRGSKQIFDELLLTFSIVFCVPQIVLDCSVSPAGLREYSTYKFKLSLVQRMNLLEKICTICGDNLQFTFCQQASIFEFTSSLYHNILDFR